MDQRSDTNDHRAFEELLAAAAVGALTPEEHAAVLAHLRSCDDCRQEYGWLLAAADALPLSVEEREPPAALRDRLRQAVEADARARGWQPRAAPPAVDTSDAPVPLTIVQQLPERRDAVSWPVWVAAAAAILLIGLLGGVMVDRLLLDDEPANEARELALQFPGDVQIEGARLSYLPDDRLLRFEAPDMPAAPEGQVWQVWLIGGEGKPPAPAGVIDEETGEFVTTVDPGRDATFAVTAEPGPIGSAEPTSDPVIVAEIR